MLITEMLHFKTDVTGFAQLSLARPVAFEYSPGQYIQFSDAEGAKVKYLALASHPSEEHLLLAGNIVTPPQTTVAISAPLGNGFGCDFGLKDGFLFVTHGSGISAIRPAIVERLKRNNQRDTLLFGARTAETVPNLDCLENSAGISQLRAYSRSARNEYVQQSLETLDLSHFGAILLVGSKEMMTACRQVLGGRNFPAERIFSNY